MFYFLNFLIKFQAIWSLWTKIGDLEQCVKNGATKACGGKLTKNPSQCLGPRRWATKAGGGKLKKNPSQCLRPRRWGRQRPLGANSRRIGVNDCGREDGGVKGRRAGANSRRIR